MLRGKAESAHTTTEPISIIMSEKDYYRDVKKFDLGAGKILSGAGAGFSWVKERMPWDFSVDRTSPRPQLSLIKFGKIDKPTVVEKEYSDAYKDIEKGELKLTKLDNNRILEL